jgi:hypothetical protein
MTFFLLYFKNLKLSNFYYHIIFLSQFFDIENKLVQLNNEFYTFCDGYSGYHQIKIRDEDVLKITFTIPWGMYAYLRMLFGLCNASGTF